MRTQVRDGERITHLVISNDKANDIVNEWCLCKQGKRTFAGFYRFTGLYITWETVIPVLLHNSPVIGSSVLTGEVLSKILVPSSHTIAVVCHAFWNLREAIYLANTPLTKKSLVYWAKAYPHILHTHFCVPLFFPYTIKKCTMLGAWPPEVWESTVSWVGREKTGLNRGFASSTWGAVLWLSSSS